MANYHQDIERTKEFYLNECKDKIGDEWDLYRQEIRNIISINTECVVWPTKPDLGE